MRLHPRRHYRSMGCQKYKFTGQWILADICVTEGPDSRLGITVTRRFGPAHQRNRFKRVVREAFRLAAPQVNFTFDIIIRPRSQAVRATMHQIKEEILAFVQRALCLHIVN